MIEGRGTVLNLNGYKVECDQGDDVFAIIVNGFGNTIKSGSGKCFRIVLVLGRYPYYLPLIQLYVYIIL